MMRRNGWMQVPSLLPLVAAALTVAPRPALAGGTLGAPLIKSGDIAVAFIGADATYGNDVYYFITMGDLGGATFLFNNHSAAASDSADPDDSGLPVGSEAIFGICVNRAGGSSGAGCADADNVFYTGAAAHNPDNLAHAMVWTRADYEAEFGALDSTLYPPDYAYVVGFEDILGGGDRDYNDAIFAVRGLGVTLAPEPVTMSLLALGLIGVGGAGLMGRRRVHAAEAAAWQGLASRRRPSCRHGEEAPASMAPLPSPPA